MNTKFANDNFVGRGTEIEKFREVVENHNWSETEVFNIHGRGGIGKTMLVKELYNLVIDMDISKENLVHQFYLNASDCYSVSILLLRLRMALNEQEMRYDFTKFDLMYHFYYDSSVFIHELQINDINPKASFKEKVKKIDSSIRENKITNIGNVASHIVAIGLAAGETISKNLPLLSQVPLPQLIELIAKDVQNEKKQNQYRELILEVGDSYLNSFEKGQKLMCYFVEAVNTSDIHRSYKNVIFLDNFQNEGRMRDLNIILDRDGLINKLSALWIFSTRDKINYEAGHYEELPVDTLDETACENLILKCENIHHLEEQNKKEVIERIKQTTRAYPLNLVVAIEVLKKQIAKEMERVPGQENYKIDVDRFVDMGDDYKKLAFYFEMGKSDIELDCFHALSCMEVWDNYTLTVLKKGIGIYLLNTKNILSNDSLVEEVSGKSLKLHEEIKDNLFDSFNNRIKFDVFEIMHEAFIDIQEKEPIADVEVLYKFFYFTSQFCEGMINGRHKHLNSTAVAEFKRFYNAFRKSEKLFKNSGNQVVFEPYFIDLYVEIVNAYISIAEMSGDYEEVAEAHKSKLDLGIVLYEAGDSQKAERVDREYLDISRKMYEQYGNALNYSFALNAVGVDFSANRKYEEALKLGILSIEIAVEALEEHINETQDDRFVQELLKYYNVFDSSLSSEQISNYDKEKMAGILSELKQEDDRNSLKQLFERILVNRGNIPWYYINNIQEVQKKWQYAVRYGEVTYELRRMYFGEKQTDTLKSYHNCGAYLMKCYELAWEDKIQIENADYEENFREAITIFKNAFYLRCESLEKRADVKGKYEEIAKLLVKSNDVDYPQIYTANDLEALLPRKGLNQDIGKMIKSGEICRDDDRYMNYMLLNCHNDALESLQYLSNAYYCLARVQNNEEDKQRLLKKAIVYGNQATLARMIAIGPKHRKTLESLFYTGIYLKECGNALDARNRVQLAYKSLDSSKVSLEHREKYKRFLNVLEEDIKADYANKN